MKHYFTIEKVPIFINFFTALALFVAVEDMGSINSFSQLAVALLEFIIFFIRDIMLIVNDKFDLMKIVSILGIVAILFIFRAVTVKYSPSSIESAYRKKT